MATRRMIRRKLLAGWIASAVLLLLLTGLVFAVMLRAAQRDYVRSDMANVFSQVAQRLEERRAQVHRAAVLLAERQEVVAGVHLLNRYEDPAAYDPLVFEPEKRRLAALTRDEARSVGVDALGLFGQDGGMAAIFTTGRASGRAAGAGYSTWIDGQRRTMPLGGTEPLPYSVGLERMAPATPPEEPGDRLLTVHDHLALVSQAPIRSRLGGGPARSIGSVLAGRVFGPDDIADIVARSGLRVAIVPEGLPLPRDFTGLKLADVERGLRSDSAPRLREVGGRLVTAAVLDLDNGRRVHILLTAEEPALGAVLSTYGEASVLALLPMVLLLIPAGALVLQRWVIGPLESLAAAAEGVRTGQAVEVDLGPRDDELGSVARAFNDMVRDLLARERDLRQSVEELSRTNVELTHFAHVAAHDLREPVRQIVTYTQLLERQLADRLGEDDRRSMDYITGSARRMYDLIGALLEYAGAGRGSGRLGEVEVGRVVQVVLDNLGDAVRSSAAEVVAGPLPTVWGDEVQLVQVFQNLIANALKFQPRDRTPHIAVSAERAGEEWIFQVRDNGIGFEADMAERVFEMFERLSPQDGYAGTGIGLPICRKIIESNGGRIWAASTPGQGATFTFTWPATVPAPAEVEA